MWRENHSNDYKFFDRRISEQFTIGGTGVLLHKYLGTNVQSNAYVTTANVTANASTLSFANVAVMEVGQAVSGMNLVANTVISTINTSANTVGISAVTTGTISSGTPISIYWRDATKPVYQNQSALNLIPVHLQTGSPSVET